MRLTAVLIVLGLYAQSLFAAVVIDGVAPELETNIRAHMRLDDESCEQDRAMIKRRFKAAPAAIQAALRPFGYYDAEVGATLEEAGDCWQASFQVTLGDPVLLDQVRLDVLGPGSDLPEFRAVLAESELRPGAQLDHGHYEATKNRLLVVSREFGFFDAKFVERRLEVDRARRAATVGLVMDTGRRYRFGELRISGEVLDERLLRRFVGFEQGAPFEQRRLRKLHNDLVRGDYFASVDVRTMAREDGTADVLLTLEEGRRIRYGVGVGFGTDTGLIVRGDMVHRRVNARGHRLELDTELARVRQNATFDYRMPGRRPQTDWLSVYGGLNREDTDAIESIAWKTGVRETRFFRERWSSNPFLELVVEQFRQDGDWQNKFSLVPGYGVNYLNANAADRPTRGVRLGAEVAVASDKVLSDASFVRLKVMGKTILPVTKRGRLLIRGEVGWMETNDFDNVPPTWRFFAGGDRSVRGYDYQSLGPVDADGKSIGGSKLLTGSVEADWRVLRRWSGAVFVDAGNVGEDDLLQDLPWSVGVGLRWYSPVGPIRLDLAFPQEGGNDFRVHVSMGPDL